MNVECMVDLLDTLSRELRMTGRDVTPHDVRCRLEEAGILTRAESQMLRQHQLARPLKELPGAAHRRMVVVLAGAATPQRAIAVNGLPQLLVAKEGGAAFLYAGGYTELSPQQVEQLGYAWPEKWLAGDEA